MFITFRLYSILSLFTEHEQLEPGRCAGWFQVALVSVRTVSATLVSPRSHNSREHNLETNILSLLDSHALPRASGPRQRTRNPRQSLCRGLPSAKTPREIFRRRRGLCRGPFIGHSAKPLPRARTALDKEKKPSRAGAVGGFFAEGRPSTKKWFFF